MQNRFTSTVLHTSNIFLPGLLPLRLGHIFFELLPGFLVIHIIFGAFLAVHIVVAHHILRGQIQLIAEAGGELYQGIISGLGEFPVSSGWQFSMEMVSPFLGALA